MKVVVYEYISGGGYAQKPIPPGFLAEGYAMLRCVVADFKAAGHEVTVFLDGRLSKLNPPIEADYTVPVFFADEPNRFLPNIAQINDAVYIIAPETNQTLSTLVKVVEATGKTSLNCKSEAIAEVSDKVHLYEKLRKSGFQTPKTAVLNINDSLNDIQQSVKHDFVFPVVFKPLDGAGCSGLSLINGESDIEKAIAKIKADSANTQFIGQEYLQGESVSVSLLCNGKKAIALSLNKQDISLAPPEKASSYEGGCVPFDHPLKQEAYGVAEQVAESFSGLRGYVGVDLILGADKVFVLDVNARLTTSYVGLRQVVDFNVAEAIIRAVVNSKLPDKPRLLGVACFKKTDTPKSLFGGFDKYQRASKVAGLVSPPFPLIDQVDATSLITGYGDTMSDAQLHLEEAKKHLQRIFG